MHIAKAIKSHTFGQKSICFSGNFDISGSYGLCYFPHLGRQHKEEPQRKDLLHISTVFGKVHGCPCELKVVLPQCASKGASLSLEALYTALFKFLVDNPDRELDTIYTQLDNCNSNKVLDVIFIIVLLLL